MRESNIKKIIDCEPIKVEDKIVHHVAANEITIRKIYYFYGCTNFPNVKIQKNIINLKTSQKPINKNKSSIQYFSIKLGSELARFD